MERVFVPLCYVFDIRISSAYFEKLLVGCRDFGLTAEFRDFRCKGERESGLEL